jgi:multiple sugar transport system substrate-binding protein
MSATPVFFYDPEEFAKQGQPEGPKTWDDVIKAAQVISKAGGGERFGYVMRAAEGNPVVADFMPIFWSYGGDLFDKDRKPNLLTPEAKKAVEVFLQLKEVSPPGVESFQRRVQNLHRPGHGRIGDQPPNWVATFESGAVESGGQDQAQPDPSGTRLAARRSATAMGIMASKTSRKRSISCSG